MLTRGLNLLNHNITLSEWYKVSTIAESTGGGSGNKSGGIWGQVWVTGVKIFPYRRNLDLV